MKFYKLILSTLAVVTLLGCAEKQVPEDTSSGVATEEIVVKADSTETSASKQLDATESFVTEATENHGDPTESVPHQSVQSVNATVPVHTQPPADSNTEETSTTAPPAAQSPKEEPTATEAPMTEPPSTQPPATEPPSTEATETAPPETAPPETEEAVTEPPATEATAPEITYEFKRQVASYAAMYINQYRGSPCTVLSGMSNVAQYRASQLTWNYSHSTADKRAALAYYEYGRYIDATEFGDDASNSYWEADSAEAICAGFKGADAEAMGKYIADMLRNSSSHWSYIGSSEYSYMGIGVECREGSQYGWYACVMVGLVNYG